MKRTDDIMSCKSTSKAVVAAALTAALASSGIALSACSANQEQESTQEESGLTFSIDDMDLDYSDRDQDASYDAQSATKIALGKTASVEGSGASANGADVTITAAGTYIISGKASDAQVLVECSDDDKVQLVLDNASVTCSDGPAVYVKSADKCFVTLAQGSKNSVSDAAGYTLTDDDGDTEPTAALFSKADLTLNGSGSLTVNGKCNNGIGSKDDLVFCGGTYIVTAANDGLRGRDCVKVKDGTFDITSTQDAVKSNNDEDTTRGFIKIDGGTWTINAGDDAFHAESAFILNDGDVTVEQCYEGYEAIQIYLNGGTTSITASDDAINAANGANSDAQNSDVKGRNFSHDNNEGDGNGASDGQTPPEKPDGEASSNTDSTGNASNADSSSADGNGTKSADDFEVKNGSAPTAPDSSNTAGNSSSGNADGSNTSGNADNSNSSSNDKPSDPPSGQAPAGDGSEPGQDGDQGGPGGGGGLDADSSCLIQINGGTITLDAQGDGIDSNGSIELNGGEVVVYGPTSGGDGALDYGTNATVNGGSIIALGSSGMAESFTSGGQAFALVSASGSAGDKVTVTDESGNTLLETKAAKDFECAVVSTTSMTEGSSYTISVAGSSTTFSASTTKSDSGKGGPGGQEPGNKDGASSDNGGQTGGDADSGSGSSDSPQSESSASSSNTNQTT